MSRHTCRNCGKVFNYCKNCTLTPMPWKAAGFCSRECSAEFKAPKIEIPEVVETSIDEADIEIKPIVKRKSKFKFEPDDQIGITPVDVIEIDGIHE